MENDDGDLRTIFNRHSLPGAGTELEWERRVARSLNCTNSEEPPAPPATAEDSGAAQPAHKEKKPRAKKPAALKRTYRPNPSFPAEMMPELQRRAADAQLCVGPYVVQLCNEALGLETKPGTQKPPPPLNLSAEQWRTLYGVANNLNQITKKLHGTGECDPKLQIMLMTMIGLLGVDKE